MRQIWDPVNRVMCKVIPAGFTFAEWRAEEEAMVVEQIRSNPAMQDWIRRRALEKLGINPDYRYSDEPMVVLEPTPSPR